jgi:ABC-2 type transport system permease protein
MPLMLQRILYFSPTAHFMEFTGAVLLRNAGIVDVWVQLAAMAGIGIFLFSAALMRFRATFR